MMTMVSVSLLGVTDLQAETSRKIPEQGMTIIGDQEAPTVLNVVPWKNKELSVDPWGESTAPSTKMMTETISPIDQEELMREIEYFDTLHGAESDTIEQ